MNEKIIQHHIFHNFYKGSKVMCNNFQWRFGEADVISISKSDMSIEYEVKCSKSDFKADFKKKAKHLRLSGVRHRKNGYLGVPNRFYYVTPVGLLRVGDIPIYAGLIEINTSAAPHASAIVVKKAPLIHSEKNLGNLVEDIAHALTIRLIYGGSYVSFREGHTSQRDIFIDNEAKKYFEKDLE